MTDAMDEGGRIVETADVNAVPLRLIGGLAILAAIPGRLLFPRGCQDIDLVTAQGQRGPLNDLMVSLGYEADPHFNALNGRRRLLYHDTTHHRQVDVFVGEFAMCHTIALPPSRLLACPVTIPLAELLLTKLQIVEINVKDLTDVASLLFAHRVGTDDISGLNGTIIGQLCARDWGLWRTTTLNLDRLEGWITTAALAAEQQALISQRVEEVRVAMASAEKSHRWRLRSRIGDRLRWYEEPEEVS